MAGPKAQGRRGPDREVYWHGVQGGRIALKERQLRVAKPRLRKKRRRADESGEVEIPAYTALQADQRVADRMLELVMHGVSTRRYASVLPALADQVGISKSEVSRETIEAGTRVLEALAERDLNALDVLVVYVDGIVFVSTPSLRKFRVFRDQLFQTPTVATAATFPAFMRPKQFPMVDRRITAWASRNGCLHSYAEVDGPELRCVPALGKDVLQDHHWPFIESWIAWCQCEFLIRRVRRIEQQVLSDTTSSRRSESERARAGDGRTRRQVSVAGRSRAAIGHDYGGEGHFSPQRERQQTWGASGDRESYVQHVIDHISHRRPGWNSRQQDPTPLDAALPIIGYQSSCTLGCG